MTVQELMQQLQDFPQDALVVAVGYEDGFDNLKKISIFKVEENPKKEWYVGKFIESESPNAKEAVLLFADTKAEDK